MLRGRNQATSQLQGGLPRHNDERFFSRFMEGGVKAKSQHRDSRQVKQIVSKGSVLTFIDSFHLAGKKKKSEELIQLIQCSRLVNDLRMLFCKV